MTTRKKKLSLNLPIIFSITLLGVMGVAILSPAFPNIMTRFGLTNTHVGLLITYFTVPSVLVTPLLGVAADRFGRKKILASSLLLFGVAGFLCGLATDFDTLLVLRVFQGLGAAALSSLNLTVIGDLYDGSRRAGVMGLNSSVLSIGTASFPLLGGALATIAWNIPFFVSLIAVPVGFAVLFYLKSPEPVSNQTIREYFSSAWKGIKNVRILSIFLLGIMAFIVLFGCISTSLSVLLGKTFNASALAIGVIMFTMSLSTALVSSQLGRLYRVFRKESMLIFGFGCYVAAMLLIALTNSLWMFIIPVMIFGFGNGMVMPVLVVMVTELASPAHRAILMSLNGAMMRIGQSLGPLLIGMAFALPNYRWAFYVGALISALALAIVFLVLSGKKEIAQKV